MKKSISFFEQQRKDNFLLLRIIAGCLVIYGHSIPLTKNSGAVDIFLQFNWGRYSGDFAVCAFFIISGFMVTGSYLRRNNFIDYAVARLLRIVPALAILIFVCGLIIGPVLTILSLKDYFLSLETYKYIIKNITFWSNLAWTLPGVFQDHRMNSVNGSLWTLPAEAKSYALVAALGVTSLLSKRHFCAAPLAAIFFMSIFQPTILSNDTELVRICGYFCLGAIAQLYKKHIPVRHEIMIGLIIITYMARSLPVYFYLLAISTTYLCFWFAYLLPHVPLEKYGDPSYGIYLWGWPVQQIIIDFYEDITPTFNFAVGVLIAIILGYLSWHLVESKAINWKALKMSNNKVI